MYQQQKVAGAAGAYVRKIPRREVIATLILFSLALGLFFPPESYFAPQDFTVTGMEDKQIGFPYARLLSIFTIGWLGFLSWQYPAMMLRAVQRCWLPLALVAWMMVTAFFTADPTASVNRTVRTLTSVIFAAYLVERMGTANILRLSIIAGVVLIVSSIFAVVVMPSYGLTTLIGYEGAWRGATIHKNTLGASMATLILQCYFARFIPKIPKKPLLITGVFSLFVLVMSQSVTALLTTAISLMIGQTLIIINKFKQSSEKAFLFSILTLVVPVGLLIQANFEQIMLLLGRSPDLTGRTDIWIAVWEQITLNPIWGYGNNFWATESALRDKLWAQLGWAAPHAHNMPLDIWFQTGVIGLLLSVVMLGTVAIRSFALLMMGLPMMELIWPVSVALLLFRGFSESALVEPNSGAMFTVTLAYAAIAKLRTDIMWKRKRLRQSMANGQRRVPLPQDPVGN